MKCSVRPFLTESEHSQGSQVYRIACRWCPHCFPPPHKIRDVGTVFLGQEFDALQELNLDTNLLVEVAGELRGYWESGGAGTGGSHAHRLRCHVG